MSETTDIGAARVRLIVDAADFQPVIDQGKRAIQGFGDTAQQAYDRTEKGTRRAADALLDYVNSLGRADTTFDKYLRTASRMGVEKPVLDAAITAWGKYTDQVEQAAAAQADVDEARKRSQNGLKELMSTQAAAESQARALANAQAATRIDNLGQARAASAQQAFNGALGVTEPNVDLQRRNDAESAFIELLNLEDQALIDNAEHVQAVQAAFKDLMSTQQAQAQQAVVLANEQAKTRIENLAQAAAANAQNSFNSLVAPGLNGGVDYQKRADAEAAFGPLIESENEALQKQAQLVDLIAQARSDQTVLTAQERFNALLGVSNSEQSTSLQLAQRRNDAMAAFLPMLEQEAREEADNASLVAKQQAFIQQLENTAATAGKTYYEMLQLKQAELGLGEAYTPLINKIRQQNESMGAGTLSAKQYEFALRGLPAQFTDIVVSLQGGQKPLTVLLQQGGQIKDMFGGVGNAVKVVGQQVAKLATNPWVLLAGVVLGLGAAAFEAQSRVTELAIATAKGNQVAGSATGLSTLADQLAKLDHISIGNADAAVTSLAAAGKLSGDNFAEAAQASARWASITGQSVDDIAGKFNQLATDPMAAVLDGTLKVTDAQYAQLVGLDRIGDKVGEVTLAVKLYQDQINDNSDSVLRNLSDGEKGWIDLKNAITGAAHAFSEFVKEAAGTAFNKLKAPSLRDFATAGISEGAIDLTGGASDVPTSSVGAPSTASGFGGPALDPAAQTAASKLTLAQVQANSKLQSSYDELGTKTQKFNTELLKLQSTLREASPAKLAGLGISQVGDSFSGAGYDKLVNGLKLKVFGQNQGGDPTRPIKEWLKTLQDALKTAQVGLDAFYADGNLSAQQYYSAQNALAQDDAKVQLDAIDQQIKALKGRENSEAQIAQLQQQRYTVEQTYATQRAKNDRDELLAITAKTNAYRDYVQGLADSNIQLSRQGDQAAAGVGMGSRQAALQQSLKDAQYQADLRDRAAQQVVDSLPAGSDHTEAQADADKKILANAAALSTQLDILKGNYTSLSTAQLDWSKGATKAWQDWSDQVANVAAQTSSLFTGMFNDLSSGLVKFARTGHLSFASFENDALEAITKIGVEFGEQQLLKLGLGAAGGTSGAASGLSGLVSLFSGSFGGGFFAQGGAFGAGSGLTAHRNSIVSKPTYFPFAKGGVPNVGLMGEKAGSPGEAIMPLTRTSSGDLGVKVSGNGGSARTIVNQTIVVPGAATRATQDQTAIKVYGAAQRAARRS